MMHLMPEPGGNLSLRKHSVKRWLLGVVALALAVLVLPELVRVTVGPNFHTVVERRFYRAAQPSGVTLKKYIEAYGIRTVINLRGTNTGEDWFDEEAETARKLGVHFVSVNMSASDKPVETEVRKLVENIDQCPAPILVHCNSGSDRSGFASACFLLLQTDATLEQARTQLSLRFGHFSWGRAACQLKILDQYKQWLDAQGVEHHSKHFRHWARERYLKDDWPS